MLCSNRPDMTAFECQNNGTCIDKEDRCECKVSYSAQLQSYSTQIAL